MTTMYIRTRRRFGAVHYTQAYAQIFDLPRDVAFLQYLWIHLIAPQWSGRILMAYCKLRIL